MVDWTLKIPPGRYKHYKGNVYEVIGIGTDCTNPIPFDTVIYRNVVTGHLFSRSCEKWIQPLPFSERPRYVRLD